MNGNRPSLDAITGPADLVSFATRWIPLCWQESPDKRPSFHGKHCTCMQDQDLLAVYLSAAALKLPKSAAKMSELIRLRPHNTERT